MKRTTEEDTSNPSWTPVVGRKAAVGMHWLEETAGPKAVQKFLGGKIRGTQFSGQYLCGIADVPEGRRIIGELLDLLRQGHGIPLCDVDSYYAAGKCWPLGMAVQGGRLVDVWESTPPQNVKEIDK